MKKINNFILPAVAAVLLIYAGFFVGYNLPKEDTQAVQIDPYTAQSSPLTREELLRLVNEERAKVGVAPLQIDERLNQSAQYKADDMVKYNYFDHISPSDGKHGYEYVDEYARGLCVYRSENIVDNLTGEYNSSTQALRGWKTSKPHYDAIVDKKYTLTGFGISGTKVVEHFCQQ